MGRRAARAWVVLVAVAWWAIAAPAWAHTDLESSSPGDGATVSAVPGEVTLVFSEATSPARSTLTLRVDGGDPVELAPASGDRPTALVATVPAETVAAAEPGTAEEWQVRYEVVSRDGHTVDGDLAFTVQVPAAPTPTPTPGDAVAAPTPPSDAVPVEPVQPASSGSELPWVVWVGGAALLAAFVWSGAQLLGRLRHRRTS